MPVRRGLAGTAAAFLFACGVAAALADPPPTTTTSETTTTTVPSTTAPTESASTATTTTASTSVASTTATSTTTSTTTQQSHAAASAAFTLPPADDCPLAALVIAIPNAAPTVIGTAVTVHARSASVSTLVYPAAGTIATTSGVSLFERSCTKSSLGSGDLRIHSLSLFGGAVTAKTIELTVAGTATSLVTGLVVDGKHVAPAVGGRVPLPWGYVLSASRTPLTIATGRRAVAAIAIHLSRSHGGLPAGATVLVAAAERTATAAPRKVAQRRRRKRARHEPLKVTPLLGVNGLVFPVVGTSEYVDTYGAFRSDVPGNWHHGDDIFAPLGTPVVAVASGTINRVGWEKVGGWRLWVRDAVGDEFYYAHLSGYAQTDLHSNRVTAGQVIGFIGNTGDAFTTSPHLHFEVHPRPLLHLGYDGAVDPTTYLNSWRHLRRARAPRPAHPPLPNSPLIRREAQYVFRELLAARHLIKHAPSPSTRPRIPIPSGANGMVANAASLPTRRRAVPTDETSSGFLLAVVSVAAIGSLALLGLTAPALRRRIPTLPQLRLRRRRR